MEYAEYDAKHRGWVIYEVRDGTSNRVTDGHPTEAEAWIAYDTMKLYQDITFH